MHIRRGGRLTNAPQLFRRKRIAAFLFMIVPQTAAGANRGKPDAPRRKTLFKAPAKSAIILAFAGISAYKIKRSENAAGTPGRGALAAQA